PAEEGWYLEEGDHLARRVCAADALRLTAAVRVSDCDGLRAIHADCRDGACEFPVCEISPRGLLGVQQREGRHVVPCADQLLRMTVGKGTQKYAVHDREDRRRRADPDRQGKNNGDAEEGSAPQRAPCVGQAVETVHGLE